MKHSLLFFLHLSSLAIASSPIEVDAKKGTVKAVGGALQAAPPLKPLGIAINVGADILYDTKEKQECVDAAAKSIGLSLHPVGTPLPPFVIKASIDARKGALEKCKRPGATPTLADATDVIARKAVEETVGRVVGKAFKAADQGLTLNKAHQVAAVRGAKEGGGAAYDSVKASASDIGSGAAASASREVVGDLYHLPSDPRQTGFPTGKVVQSYVSALHESEARAVVADVYSLELSQKAVPKPIPVAVGGAGAPSLPKRSPTSAMLTPPLDAKVRAGFEKAEASRREESSSRLERINASTEAKGPISLSVSSITPPPGKSRMLHDFESGRLPMESMAYNWLTDYTRINARRDYLNSVCNEWRSQVQEAKKKGLPMPPFPSDKRIISIKVDGVEYKNPSYVEESSCSIM